MVKKIDTSAAVNATPKAKLNGAAKAIPHVEVQRIAADVGSSDEDVLRAFHEAADKMLSRFGIVEWKRWLVNFAIAVGAAAIGGGIVWQCFEWLATLAMLVPGFTFVAAVISFIGIVAAGAIAIGCLSNATAVGEFARTGAAVVGHKARGWFGSAKSAVTSFELPKFGKNSATVH